MSSLCHILTKLSQPPDTKRTGAGSAIIPGARNCGLCGGAQLILLQPISCAFIIFFSLHSPVGVCVTTEIAPSLEAQAIVRSHSGGEKSTLLTEEVWPLYSWITSQLPSSFSCQNRTRLRETRLVKANCGPWFPAVGPRLATTGLGNHG